MPRTHEILDRSTPRDTVPSTFLELAQSHEEVISACRSLATADLSPALLRQITRALDAHPADAPYRIAFLANVTSEPLPSCVNAVAACHGIATRSHIGGYNQFMQEILDPGSALHSFSPDLVSLQLSLDELEPDLARRFSGVSEVDRRDACGRILATLSDTVDHALRTTTATVLVANFPAPPTLQMGTADQKEGFGERELYLHLNLEMLRLFRSESRVRILDLDRIAAAHGTSSCRDARLYYLAKIPWSESLVPRIADEIVRHIEATRGATKKCLVLDLDNTLWGGIVGELGPEGIEVGRDHAAGQAFFDFQCRVADLKDQGVVLTIASKNNPEDVREAFERRPEMPLRLDDFVTTEISWGMKHESIRRIAEKLNIGLDSIVFVDDNPAECELVRQMLPEVTTVQLPGDPAEHVRALTTCHGFDRASRSTEDREKTRQYKERRKREDGRTGFARVEDYLHSLRTRLTIRPAGPQDRERIHQLFSKTNQFNVTTRRYSLSEVDEFLREERFDLSIVEAVDRFGDLGKIGLALVETESPERARVDSFVLSCRAMGRGVETAMMNFVKSEHLDRRGADLLVAHYAPTPKNKPASGFFDDQGFTLDSHSENDGSFYRLDSRDAAAVGCDWIRVNNSESQ